MPDAARLINYVPGAAAGPQHGDANRTALRGSAVAAMHHTIAQRLMWDAQAMAVIPLPQPPLEAMLAHVSRLAGWAAVAAVASGAAYGVFAAVH